MGNDDGRKPEASAIGAQATKIWNEVLGVAGTGQEKATFFELRGQSITAVQIVTRLEEELGVWVDIGDLFEDPDRETFVKDVVARHAQAAQDRAAKA